MFTLAAFLPGMFARAAPEPKRDYTSEKLAALFIFGTALASLPFWMMVLK